MPSNADRTPSAAPARPEPGSGRTAANYFRKQLEEALHAGFDQPEGWWKVEATGEREFTVLDRGNKNRWRVTFEEVEDA